MTVKGEVKGQIQEQYRKANPTSERLARRARQAVPGGITHDVRNLKPFPVYVDRAQGTRKWTVDGGELVDYWMGHGSLFLGHGHPRILEAVRTQLGRGTHYGACHEPEIRWAELVQRLIPSAERVRFTASGTEATHLALRLARAAAGKPMIVKLEGHFHGWHDGVAAGVKPPYDIPMSAGVPAEVLGQTILCPPNDLTAIQRLLDERKDVAGIILEPGGGNSGILPMDIPYLRALRELATRHGVVLIFDEVITGFRVSPGGVQAAVGVIPDLTTVAKILAGGLPGGAVVGKCAVMDQLAFGPDPAWNRRRRVAQAGTYNANPLSAAAGIVMLEMIADGTAQSQADRAAASLRDGLQAVWRRLGAPGQVFGDSSVFAYTLEENLTTRTQLETASHRALQSTANPEAYHALRCALILHGADTCNMHGWVSAMHSEEDVARTILAFERALTMLRADGYFPR
ncbi:MAG: aminotransferase class III-fold pyridoxal phosphate-dependent enzyme [Candidatus Methylomirabilota bacterium]